MNKINKLKAKTLKIYKNWQMSPIYCPAFKEQVYFSMLGWHHLLKPKGRVRKNSDVYRRLSLLPYARKILITATTVKASRIKNQVTYYAIESKKVRVIIIQTKTGKKFYSVMSMKMPKKNEVPYALSPN